MPSPEDQRLDIISEALARLVRKEEEIERRLQRIEVALSSQSVPEPVVAPPPTMVEAPRAMAEPPPLPIVPSQPIFEQIPEPAPHVESEAHPERLETSIGLTLVNRIGAITLVLGIAFFFKWAVDNQWIGPAGRVMLGVLAGFAAIAGSDFLWKRGQKVFAQGGTAVGVSILYLALYAAYGFYDLVPQWFAFLALVSTTALAGALALRYNSQAIAALGLLAGYLTPMILSSGEDHAVFLFSYLLLLDVAAMALARSREWSLLQLLSFVGTGLLYIGWFSSQYKPEKHLIGAVFLLLFYGLYAATTSLQIIFLFAQFATGAGILALEEKAIGPFFVLALLLAAAGLVVSDRRQWRSAVGVSLSTFWLWSVAFAANHRTPVESIFLAYTLGYLLFFSWVPWVLLKRREHARPQDMAVLAVNSAAYFGASYWLLNPEYHAWMGLFAVAVAGINLALGYELWRRQPEDQKDPTPILLTIAVATTLLTLAAPIQFTSWRITMAWSLEGAALTWIGVRLRSDRMVQVASAVFLLALLRLLCIDAWIYWDYKDYATLLNDRFITFAISAASLWLATLWLEKPAALRLGYYLAGHVVLLWALTQEVVGWAARTAAPENLISVETFSISALYTLYGVGFVALGVATRSVVNRIAGLVLIGIVVLKLYLFDVWQLAKVYRTLAFVVLGVMMLSTSFLYSKFRPMIEGWWKDDETQS